MTVTLNVVRVEKATTEIAKGEPGERITVAAAGPHGAWTMRFPIDFAKQIHVGQTLSVDVVPK